MSNTLEVGKKLVELCRQGKGMEAVNALYSPKIVSLEVAENPSGPARVEGLAAIRGKHEWWAKNHEIHRSEAEGPWPHGDRFIVHFKFEVTPKTGPMAGKRMTHDETALFTVKDGKIVHEEFFYHMG